MGYKVTVYYNNGREIDFFAEKGNLHYYIQVAYSIAEDKEYQRVKMTFRPTFIVCWQLAVFFVAELVVGIWCRAADRNLLIVGRWWFAGEWERGVRTGRFVAELAKGIKIVDLI